MDLNQLSLGETANNAVNVTSLCDVALILVQIFLVTSPFFLKPLNEVTLPQAVTSKSESDQNISITISPKDGFSINEIPMVKEALQKELQRKIRTTGISYVLIRADERVPHGEIEDIMVMCKATGARRIAFATLPKGMY